MATITSYETKAGKRWRVRYRKPDRSQTDKRGFKTKRDASEFAATVETSKITGTYIDPTRGKATIAALGKRWLDGQTHLKPSTLHSVESTWRVHVLEEWGDRAVAEIEHSEIQDWVTMLSKGDGENRKAKSATTVKRAHGILSAILHRAALDKRIPANPAAGINLPRKTSKARAYLNDAQVELLAVESKAHGTLIRVMAYTGLRWGEITGLHVSDVNFLRKRITVSRNAVTVNGRTEIGTPKTHRERWVPFPEFLRADLAEAAKGKSRDDVLFGQGNVYMLPPSSRDGWFSHAVKRCQAQDSTFPRVTPHDLRHTTASLAIAAGANVKAVQRMLGHASAAMTLDVYADLFDDDLEAVAAAFDLKRGQNVGKTA